MRSFADSIAESDGVWRRRIDRMLENMKFAVYAEQDKRVCNVSDFF